MVPGWPESIWIIRLRHPQQSIIIAQPDSGSRTCEFRPYYGNILAGTDSRCPRAGIVFSADDGRKARWSEFQRVCNIAVWSGVPDQCKVKKLTFYGEVISSLIWGVAFSGWFTVANHPWCWFLFISELCLTSDSRPMGHYFFWTSSTISPARQSPHLHQDPQLWSDLIRICRS